MSAFIPPFSVGDVISNQELSKTFAVGNMGGMRRSLSKKLLVIITDHTKGLYDDKWYGDVLHYTGMGKTGDQVLTGNQNRTLAESNQNGVTVHLFEVQKPSQYIYQGVVTLCGKPYQEKQKDENGTVRNVWMFPLRSATKFASITEHELDAYIHTQQRTATKLPLSQLTAIASEHSTDKPTYRKTAGKTYIRDPYVAELAKRKSHGICQLCGKPAPFKDKDGKPYLESHHIIWLSDGGEDSIANTIALCPNCHRKMHVINDPRDVAFLRKKAMP